MLERMLSYEALHAPASPSEPQWLFRRHVADFALASSSENNALFGALCARVAGFNLLEGATRDGSNLLLPLHYGFLRARLHGTLAAEYLSAEHGERRSHLEGRFPLHGGWELHLKHIARQDLLSGRVRLTTELWFKPGHALSFRWMILSRALRYNLSQNLSGFQI